MPSSELSYDAYRFRRLNGPDPMKSSVNPTSRLKNIAKVEPYSINTNMVRPLYQPTTSPSSSSQPSTKITTPALTTRSTTAVVPSSSAVLSQGHSTLNSMGNTPTPSSTSSSSAGSLTGMIRHPNIRQSDFLVPNPTYSTVPPFPTNLMDTFQSVSNSSNYSPAPSTSMRLSESLSQDPSQSYLRHQTAFQNGRSTSLASSINEHQQKQRMLPNEDFHPNKVIINQSANKTSKRRPLIPTFVNFLFVCFSFQQVYSPSVYQTSNISRSRSTLNKQELNPPPISYQYRSRELPASTTAIHMSHLNENDKYHHGSTRSMTIDHQYQIPQQPQFQREDEKITGAGQQNQSSRRRFQRRKQMKRSKSADLYQEQSPPIPSKASNGNQNYFLPPTGQESKKYSHHPRSMSRDMIATGGPKDGNLSSSSSGSSTSTARIEQTNRAALLRYKSLDSMAFNNRKSTLNGKNQNRRVMSKPMNMDFDSDDSVCGIPKPRK